MDYTNEIAQLHDEIVEKLNGLIAPLANANAKPSTKYVLASVAFAKAVKTAQLFTSLESTSFEDAELIKARLSATGDILADVLLEERAAHGV